MKSLRRMIWSGIIIVGIHYLIQLLGALSEKAGVTPQ